VGSWLASVVVPAGRVRRDAGESEPRDNRVTPLYPIGTSAAPVVRWPASDVEPDGPHQGQGVAVLNDAGAHPVVEPHGAVHKLVLEMHVRRARREALGDLGECEVVGRDQPDGPAVDQALHHRPGANDAVVRVGAVEDLVEQEQERPRPFREANELSDPRDLGVEPRPTRLEASPGSSASPRSPAPRPEAGRPEPEHPRAPGPRSYRPSAGACSCPTCSSR